MRRLLAGLCLSLLVAPAAGAQQMVADYETALRIFFGGTADIETYFNDQRSKITEGLDGRWVSLNRASPNGSGLDEAFVETLCKRMAFTIETTSAITFRMTQFAGTPDAVAYDYTSISGAMFAQNVDVDAYMRWQNLSLTDERKKRVAFMTLARINRPVTFYRVSPDILVAVSIFGDYPTIYGRCD